MNYDAAVKPPVTGADTARRVDSAQAHVFEWGSIQWLASQSQFARAELTFGHVEIKPGAKNPLHIHPNCDEVLFLLEGALDHSVGDSIVRLAPGMSLFIPRNAEHDARNVGPGTARMVVAYSSGDRQTIMLEAGEE